MKKTIELEGQTYRLVAVKPRKKYAYIMGPEQKKKHAEYMVEWRARRKNEIDSLYAFKSAMLAERAGVMAPADTVTELAALPSPGTE
jgi:hypothetical protein